MLTAEGSDTMTHALELIEEKFSVKIPEQDVQDVHFMPGGNIILRIWNVSPKSAYKLLVDRVKSGKGKQEVPIFLSFQLTKRRSTILFHLRTLKREGKIFKYYSDENGAISVRTKEGGPKVKLTGFPSKKNTPGAPMKTVSTRDEIVELAGIDDTSAEI